MQGQCALVSEMYSNTPQQVQQQHHKLLHSTHSFTVNPDPPTCRVNSQEAIINQMQPEKIFLMSFSICNYCKVIVWANNI